MGLNTGYLGYRRGYLGGLGTVCLLSITWEFPKIRGALFWGPCNKDRTI